MSPTSATLTQLLNRPCEVLSAQPVSGGCISEAWRVRGVDPASPNVMLQWFVKSESSERREIVLAEKDGLAALGRAAPAVDGLNVPAPIAVGVVDHRAWLLMPWVQRRLSGAGSLAQSDAKIVDQTRFGRALARLHRQTLGSDIGWHRDNFLGSTPQRNTWSADWVDFVGEHRIGFQLHRAVDAGLADASLTRDCKKILSRLDHVLAGHDWQTSLIHGDLWSGNFFADDGGQTTLVDPAIYRGSREAEFGMLKLFGGCCSEFYEAYQSEFPLGDGWQDRVRVYVLYHLLNHLNLFGPGYLSQCKACARAILAG